MLRDHLQDALQMDRKDVVINGLTRQIIIKVYHIYSLLSLRCALLEAAYGGAKQKFKSVGN